MWAYETSNRTLGGGETERVVNSREPKPMGLVSPEV